MTNRQIWLGRQVDLPLHRGARSAEISRQGRLVVNEHSASAAEMLAAFAAENNLAKIVGTKTAGRLLSGSAFRVGHGYILVLPTAAYLTWSGRSLEGTGIMPDVEIDATYESLRAGEDVQLQKATEVVMQM